MLWPASERAKLINDLPPEFRKLIEDVTIDRSGNVIPKLYSKAQANKGLRELLNIGRTEDRPESDVARLSDAELIQQLADQAKQLGVEIKLDYSFAQQARDTAPPDLSGGEVVEHEPVAAEVPAEPPAVDTASADTAAVDAARDLKIGLSPAVAGARRIKGGRR